ncbi:MAG: hypothetical protein KGO96_10660 [Elusimicrobia bacterium]|nr:hypothetical protein [Elusimicrobiota bacterium]
MSSIAEWNDLGDCGADLFRQPVSGAPASTSLVTPQYRQTLAPLGTK